MIPRDTLQPLLNSFVTQAAAITGDVNLGASFTEQPAPLLAVVMVAWKPGGDRELQSCQMVRRIERDPTGVMPVAEQIEGWLVVMLAEIEKQTTKPVIH